MKIEWEGATYQRKGSGMVADVISPQSGITHRLYAYRVGKGARQFQAMIDGEVITGCWSTLEMAMAQVAKEARARYETVSA